MKFRLGVGLAIVGLIVFLVGVLTPYDPNLSPKAQPRLTISFFAIFPAIGGLLLIFASFFDNDRDQE